MNKIASAIGLAAVFLGACASPRMIGRQTKVMSLPEKQPDWTAKASFERGERLFFHGAVTGRSDMALGLREARAEAEKKLAEEVRQRIRTEFGAAIEGQNVDGNTGSYVLDRIAKASENVAVSGVAQNEQYVEKIEETTAAGVRYVWDCYTLVSIARSDYLQARQDALGGALALARDEKNRKAEEALNRAFRKLEGAAASAEPKP